MDPVTAALDYQDEAGEGAGAYLVIKLVTGDTLRCSVYRPALGVVRVELVDESTGEVDRDEPVFVSLSHVASVRIEW